GVGNGPSLKFGGTEVVAGQFDSWTPIGAEKTASGYEVAGKNDTADQYGVWNTDANGNFLSSVLSAVPGAAYGLQSLETSFQQDLNGDGITGVPTPAFNIDIDVSRVPLAYQSYFTAAAQRWGQVIVGDLPGFNVPGYGFVDDLHITASVT